MKIQKTPRNENSKKNESSNPTKANAETLKSEPKGFYLGSEKLDKELAGFCQRSETRRKGSFESAYQDGLDLDQLIKNLEGDKYKHLKRRPNNTSPYQLVASYPDCRFGSKQLARQHQFFLTVNAIKNAGYEPPMLGVTCYAESARLKSVEMIVATLQQVVSEDLSVRELIAIIDQQVPPEKEKTANDSDASGDQLPVDWNKALGKFIWAMNVRLAEIDEAMPKTNLRLDKETAKALRDLRSALGNILKKAGK